MKDSALVNPVTGTSSLLLLFYYYYLLLMLLFSNIQNENSNKARDFLFIYYLFRLETSRGAWPRDATNQWGFFLYNINIAFTGRLLHTFQIE